MYGILSQLFVQSCGQRLFDDFIETRPGAAEELRVALDTFDRQRPTSHCPAYPAASYQSYSGSTNMSGNPTRDSATSPAGAIDPNFTPPRSIYDPPPTSGGLFSTNLRRDEPPESKWLLICAQAWRRPTSLLHLDVCSTTSDKQLFRDLRQSYLELKRAWWHRLSLKVVQSIRFVQVSNFFFPLPDDAVNRCRLELTINPNCSSNSIPATWSTFAKSPTCRPHRAKMNTSTNPVPAGSCRRSERSS